MDTRFWGHDGWRLLHSIAYLYKPETSQQTERFLTLVKDILPCRYCRQSFAEFLEELPITSYLTSSKKLRFWLYKIHNKVNNKLRNQGLLQEANPTLEYVDDLYANVHLNPPVGWDFLYSIIYNYSSKSSATIKPQIYEEWFSLLGQITPCPRFRELYKKLPPIQQNLKTAKDLQRWFYEFQKLYYNSQHVKCSSFTSVCKRYESIKVPICSNSTSNQSRSPPTATCRK
jgi:hypothetical protein